MVPGVHVRTTLVRAGTNPVKDSWAKILLSTNIYDSEDPKQNPAHCPDVEETVALIKASA